MRVIMGLVQPINFNRSAKWVTGWPVEAGRGVSRKGLQCCNKSKLTITFAPYAPEPNTGSTRGGQRRRCASSAASLQLRTETRRDSHGEAESPLLPLLILKSCLRHYGSVGGDLCRAGFHMQPDADRNPPRVEYTPLFSFLPALRDWDCGADRETCAISACASVRARMGASLGALGRALGGGRVCGRRAGRCWARSRWRRSRTDISGRVTKLCTCRSAAEGLPVRVRARVFGVCFWFPSPTALCSSGEAKT